jgi:putative ABC transport system permease protein
MDNLFQDLRYALRRLFQTPGFTAIAVITLALGIGANTAIFTVIEAVLLRPLPFPERDRLVMVWETHAQRPGRNNVIGPRNFIRWQEQQTVFADLAAMAALPVNITGDGEPMRAGAGVVTPNLFSVLGVQPVMGRAFTANEGAEGQPLVTVISHGLWQTRFGSDPSVLGKSIVVNDRPRTIIGVAPPGMSLPETALELWLPIVFTPPSAQQSGRWMMSVARLKPGVSREQAQSEMATIAKRLEQATPDTNALWGVNVEPIQQHFTGNVRKPLLVLLGAVALVLLIACANVANLLLARAAARDREVAVRVALGVSRWRLVQQLLAESIVLSLIGAAAGLALAVWGLDSIVALIPAEVSQFTRIGLNLPVLAFTLVLAVLTGILFGLAPALRAVHLESFEALKEGGRGTSTGAGHRWIRNSLVVGEAALALVLLVGAGLLMKSFYNLVTVDPGFNPERLVTVQIDLPPRQYAEEAQQAQFYTALVDALKQQPMIESVAAIQWLPFQGLGANTDFRRDDRPTPAPGDEPGAHVRSITPGYFKTMGIPLLRGRLFDERDKAGLPTRAVIINTTAAELHWPGEDPIGKRLTMPWGEDLKGEIVGIVGDIKLRSLTEDPQPTMYWHMPQFQMNFMTVVARSQAEPGVVATAIRDQVRALNPNLPLGEVRTMNELLARSLDDRRFTMLLLATFAALALVLAAVGLYGVMSYAVVQRTHELGVRMALGAGTRQLSRMVMGEGLGLVVLGIAIGLVGSWIIVRFLQSLLFGVSGNDPLVFGVVPVMLVAVTLLATYIPARRATRVDPMVAIRYE